MRNVVAAVLLSSSLSFVGAACGGGEACDPSGGAEACEPVSCPSELVFEIHQRQIEPGTYLIGFVSGSKYEFHCEVELRADATEGRVVPCDRPFATVETRVEDGVERLHELRLNDVPPGHYVMEHGDPQRRVGLSGITVPAPEVAPDPCAVTCEPITATLTLF